MTISFSRYLLLLLGAIFVLDMAGPLPDEFILFIGVLLLYIFYFASIPSEISSWKSPSKLAGFGLTIGATILFVLNPLVRPFAFSIFLSGCVLSGGNKPKDRFHPEALVLAATIYAILYHLIHSSALAWYVTNLAARVVSDLLGKVTAHPLSLGETFGGIKTILLFAVFIFSTRIAAGRKKWPDHIYPLIFVLVAWISFMAYILFLSDIYDFAVGTILHGSVLSETQKGAHILSFLLLAAPLVLFVMLIPGILFMIPKPAASAHSIPNVSPRNLLRQYAPPAAIIILSTIAFQLLGDRDVQKRREPGEILMYEKGFLNWLTPHHGEYGEYSAGMFGNLTKHFKSLGIQSRLVSQIREEELQSASGLILMNIDHEIPDEQLEAAWKFVHDGGTMLVLGDHTFRKPPGINWLNTCLTPFDIRYNFDSAEYMIGGWLNSYRFMHHPLTCGLKDDSNQLGIVVGASLSIKPPAAPVIVGAYGFSDAGDEHGDSTGYLGNLQYDRGEPIGDLILAASQQYGKGRILVFGDTSAFTNPISIWSFPFIKRVFAWMIVDSREGVLWVRELVAVLCLLVTMILIFRLEKRVFCIYLFIPAVLLIFLQNHRQSELLDITPKGPIAYVDISHKARIPMEGWRDGGVMGLQMNLQRDGYLTYVLNDFDKEYITEAELLVMVAPSQTFTEEERSFLKQYVSDGGHLLLCIGYEERTASLGLLSELGLRVDSTPLGGFECAVSDTITATFIESWPVYDLSGQGEYLAYYEQYPLIVYKRIGEGGVLLIGDSDFFMNENLEHDNHPHMEMIGFLRYLINYYLKNN